MTKRALTLLFLLALTVGMALRASADMGPKPSVVLEFEGLEGRQYAATLLADTERYGPWSTETEYYASQGDKAYWEAFRAYEAPEGWHFLGEYEECTETQRFAWTYYPPQRFYVLLYFLDSGEYWRSPEVYESYAFDSYFTVTPALAEKAVRTSYDYSGELFSLVCRVALTVAVEQAVAHAFGLRRRRHRQIVLRTNLVTQLLLNVALNLFNYKSGPMMFWFMYIWLELAVFWLEGLVYKLRFPPAQTEKEAHPWRYSFAANAASCVAGAVAARYIPGLF